MAVPASSQGAAESNSTTPGDVATREHGDKEQTPRDPDVVDFDGDDDPTRPLNWSTARKTTAITIVSLNALLSPIGSTISAGAAASIMQDLGTSNEALGALMTTIYLLGYAFGPFLIAPLSELYGKRIMFRICALLFCVFNVACALANTFDSLIVFRLLAGIAGSCPGTLGASSIADIIPREKRGAAMAAYVLGPTFGPTLGPIISGSLTTAAGWRWGFWLMAIASGVVALLVFVFIHESYPYAILKRRTARLQSETGNVHLRSVLDKGDKTPRELFAIAILRPLKMLVCPIIFLQSAYAAVMFSYAYLCFTTFPRVFRDQYGFDSRASGLATMGIGIGFIIGLVFCMVVSDKWASSLAKKHGGVANSKDRIPPLMVGALFVPVGLFWYGWTAEFRVHWILPIIGTGVLGIGIVIVYSTSATYLVDVYSVYSASVMAASATLRCLCGALLPLAGPAMFDALGVGWGNSLLGFISVAFIPLPLVFYYYGEKIRQSKGPFAGVV